MRRQFFLLVYNVRCVVKTRASRFRVGPSGESSICRPVCRCGCRGVEGTGSYRRVAKAEKESSPWQRLLMHRNMTRKHINVSSLPCTFPSQSSLHSPSHHVRCSRRSTYSPPRRTQRTPHNPPSRILHLDRHFTMQPLRMLGQERSSLGFTPALYIAYTTA
jgi:hypothetical protein